MISWVGQVAASNLGKGDDNAFVWEIVGSSGWHDDIDRRDTHITVQLSSSTMAAPSRASAGATLPFAMARRWPSDAAS